MLLSSYSALEFSAWEALASSDQDGDGLSYGLEFYINTQPQDWDSDNDGLPDGWEWQYGLNPLSPNGDTAQRAIQMVTLLVTSRRINTPFPPVGIFHQPQTFWITEFGGTVQYQ